MREARSAGDLTHARAGRGFDAGGAADESVEQKTSCWKSLKFSFKSFNSRFLEYVHSVEHHLPFYV